MKKHYFLTVAGCWLFIPWCWAQLDASQVIKWDSEVLAEGLVLRTFQADLGEQPQAIQLLEVDLRKRDLTLVYSHPKHRPTSEIARSANGLAAINAGFSISKWGFGYLYQSRWRAAPSRYHQMAHNGYFERCPDYHQKR